jgi:undecaprenyl-phosphate galactose phosphotransferase
MTQAATIRARRWAQWVPYIQALGDMFAFFLAFYFGRLSHAFYNRLDPVLVLMNWWGNFTHINFLLFFLLAFAGITAFSIKGHYSQRKAFWDEVGEMVTVFILLLALNAAIAFSGKWFLSRLWLFTSWGLALIFIPLIRWFLRYILLHIGAWNRPVVIIGSGKNAIESIRAFGSEPILGHSVQCVLIPEGGTYNHETFPLEVSVLPLGIDPMETLGRMGNPNVVLALDMDQWEEQESLVRSLSINYPDLIIAPPLRGLPLFGMEVMHFFSHEVLMLRVRNNLARFGPRLLKRIFDLLVALVLIFLLSPVFLYIMWRIRKEDHGPSFYSQERVGHHGKSFYCLKFRSMVIDADEKLIEFLRVHPELREEYDRTFKLKDDPRITPIGKQLRRTSLDELPQLFNVLRGEMGLVGPRPVTAQELDKYYGSVGELYKLVHPGITGLWQVSGRSDTTYSERIYLDSWYIKNWSLWYDIVILIRTVKVVFRSEGAY